MCKSQSNTCPKSCSYAEKCLANRNERLNGNVDVFASALTREGENTPKTAPIDLGRSVSAVALLALCLLTGCGSNKGGQLPASNAADPSSGSSGTTHLALVLSGPTSVPLGTPVSFSASESGFPATDVIWSLDTTGRPAQGLGQISSAGLYTPPAVLPANTSVILKAISQSKQDVSAFLTIQLENAAPVVNSATITTSPGSSVYVVTVGGSGFLNGATVNIGGVSVTPDQVSASGVYTTLSLASLSQLSIGQTVLISAQNPESGGMESAPVNAVVQGPSTSVIAAARLLDQATFGPTMATIQHVQSVGLPAFLNEQLAQEAEQMPYLPWNFSSLQASCMPFFSCFTDGYWDQFAMSGSDQLRQRVAFALSKIWNVSYFATPVQEFPYFLNILSTDAFSNYRTIMQDITLSDAMGTYLNMLNSPAPDQASHANENFAREMMQLFTLGPVLLNDDGSTQVDSSGHPIPTYTPDQVQALARAYTGWTIANADCSAPAAFQTVQKDGQLKCAMAPVESQHDKTEKILLDGVMLPAGQTAEEDLKGALDDVFNNANLPPFVVQKLIQNLVTSSPSPQYIERVVQVFKNNGHGVRGDMAAVLTALLLDPEAREADSPAVAATGGHLRDPALWMFAVLRALGASQNGDESAFSSVSNWQGAMGEMPHSQPSVFGFYSPSYLIPGTTIVGPEFQLETPGNFNNLSEMIDQNIPQNYRLEGQNSGGISVDLTATSPLGQLALQGVTPLIDGLNTLFLHGRMNPAMQQVLTTELSKVNPGDSADEVYLALYLVLTSPQFRVIQ